ncbi:hypothetical protein LOTGIDRAFT_123415 [Lottia gigantea]|uniref:ADAMTS cysteine-rich domain-containing protein n=1 Tax=Lottia gigantea TaxID=225164 RepID=V4AAE6_LOTGI|nr:hypothetical protein LOTGIDRAFT_123415 [Lottia gigantea]ESO90281.1 hypothetical protein LOTGIDRAFT_123415 [Lottia gigantea]
MFYFTVDGSWGNWGQFSTCSKPCGGGMLTRQRLCDNPSSANGGATCIGDQTETKACAEDPCPVDGKWGAWSNYDTCSTTCGRGTQKRTRQCDNPASSFGGATCSPPGSETQSCNPISCLGSTVLFFFYNLAPEYLCSNFG